TTGAITGGLAVVQPEVREPHRVVQPDRTASRTINDGLQLGERELVGHGTAHPPFALRSITRHRDYAPRSGMTEREKHGRSLAASERVKCVATEPRLRDGAGIDITQQEVLKISITLESNPGEFADAAVSAVAADNIARTNPLLGTVAIF